MAQAVLKASNMHCMFSAFRADWEISNYQLHLDYIFYLCYIAQAVLNNKIMLKQNNKSFKCMFVAFRADWEIFNYQRNLDYIFYLCYIEIYIFIRVI